MTHHAFTFAGHRLHALPSGALHWPDQHLLAVSDLHFGKSERLARRGGSLLPPYETQATLAKLDADLAATQALTVLCLGDSFDDAAASAALETADSRWLARLMTGRDWTWISGNHDPDPLGLTGRQSTDIHLNSISFRHIASAETPEVSGHYHPKAQLVGRPRPCFLIDAERVILPAYGTYTGGLPCTDPALLALMSPHAIAVLTGQSARAIPMPRGHNRLRSSSFSR